MTCIPPLHRMREPRQSAASVITSIPDGGACSTDEKILRAFAREDELQRENHAEEVLLHIQQTSSHKVRQQR